MAQLPLKKARRPFLLLEVLIAFLLIALCAIPLIAPHVSIYKDQQEFMDKIQLDHFVNHYYGEIIEKLYRQNISWETLSNEAKVRIDREKIVSWDNKPLPYEGTYSFKDKKHKPKEAKPFTVYLIQLTLSFKPIKKGSAETKTKDITYQYDIFIPRQLPGETPEKPDEKDKKK